MSDTEKKNIGATQPVENNKKNEKDFHDKNPADAIAEQEHKNLIPGQSSAKERKARAKKARTTVNPNDVKDAAKENSVHLPFAIKAGLVYMAGKDFVRGRQMEKLLPEIKRLSQEIQKNAGDPYQRIRKEQLLHEAEKKQARLMKSKMRAQRFGMMFGRVTGAAQMMARTTMMGAGAGIIRADDKGISRNVIPTISSPGGSSNVEQPSL